MASLIQRAEAFAIEVHKDQRYGNLPYYYHLSKVAKIAAENIESSIKYERIVASAWLHDCVEDTDATLHDIREKFGGNIAKIVDACTDGIGENRKERKVEAYKKLAISGWEARRVKLADRIANMTASIENEGRSKMYRNEFPDFMRICGLDNENNDLIIKIFWLYMHSVESSNV